LRCVEGDKFGYGNWCGPQGRQGSSPCFQSDVRLITMTSRRDK